MHRRCNTPVLLSDSLWLMEKDDFVGSSGLSRVVQTACERGELSLALQTLDILDQHGTSVSRCIFSCVLRMCIGKEDLLAGRKVHSIIINSGLKSDAFLCNLLIRVFTVCGSLLEAHWVFRQLPNPNAFIWCSVISAHNKLGQGQEAFELYHQMQQCCVKPDGHVFVAILQACANSSVLQHGESLHVQIIESGLEGNEFVGSALIDMYGRCGNTEASRSVFNKLSKRDIVIWSAMIASYAEHGNAQEAFQLFWQMQQDGLKPNHITFATILKACASTTNVIQGKMIHVSIIENGCELDVLVGNNLINMYGKCGRLDDASRVFERLSMGDVVTWNAIIAGYTQQGHALDAIELLEQMLLNGLQPDQVTFISILSGHINTISLSHCKLIHSMVIENGVELDPCIGSNLIDTYVNCNSLQYARDVFEMVPRQDVVIWSAMIAGYVQFNHGWEAIQLFQQMQPQNVEPDSITFVNVLNACCITVALDQGKLIHSCIVNLGFETDIFVGNTIVNMYSRCGKLKDACGVFFNLQKRDQVTWNAIIAGYAHDNDYLMALQYFRDMQQDGLKPNDVTFVSLLSACSHTGLVNEGRFLFKSLREDFGILPVLDHYNSMVDLLGRAGLLREAKNLLNCVPFRPNIVGWICLLSHCRTHRDVDIGRHCFAYIRTVDIGNATGHMLMSEIYALAGMDADAFEMEGLRLHLDAYKKPGEAFIEIDNKVNYFIASDQSHPESHIMHSKLIKLNEQLKDEGYMPQVEEIVKLYL